MQPERLPRQEMLTRLIVLRDYADLRLTVASRGQGRRSILPLGKYVMKLMLGLLGALSPRLSRDPPPPDTFRPRGWVPENVPPQKFLRRGPIVLWRQSRPRARHRRAWAIFDLNISVEITALNPNCSKLTNLPQGRMIVCSQVALGR